MKNILNSFKSILGQYCSTIQFIELSMRSIQSEHEIGPGNKPEFIALANKYSLTLTSYDLKQLTNTVVRSYIINVHACFEAFLNNLQEHIKHYGCNPLATKKDGISQLKYISDYVYTKGIPDVLKPYNEICEYYRLVRNDSVHAVYTVAENSKFLKKLQLCTFKRDAKFGKLNAPNEANALTFDDFVMFARSVKIVASELYSSFEYDYKKVIATYDEQTRHGIRNFINDRKRGENYLHSLICTDYKDSPALNDQISLLFDSLIRSPNG